MRLLRPLTSLRVLAPALLALIGACSDGVTAPDPLAAPATVTATTQGSTAVQLSWAAVAGAERYEVDRATATGTFATVATVTTTTFRDSTLVAETSYKFRVRALRGTEQGPYSTEATALTGDRPVVQVSADITANTTWSNTNVYQLTKVISVANGATLTIQAGTKIIGGTITTGQAPPVSALMVLRGSRLNAVGTAAQPIVFTSSAAAGSRAPGDWGGLILVGNARSNRTGRTVVEGPAPADTVSWNGGNLDNDNSGEIVFTRVEFAGAAAILNVELNSYSMYAVGSNTRFEYNQAIRGLDDMFEWFGGTVDGRYLVSYESGDDHFDMAEGYRGRLQYLIALQTGPRVSPRAGNPGALSAEQNGFEIDGCGSASGTCALGFSSEPYTMPVVANFTILGPGGGVLPVRSGGDGGVGMLLRRGTGGTWMNGVVARWPESGLSMFDSTATFARLAADSLDVFNTLLANNGRAFDVAGATNRFGTADKFTDANITTSTAAAHLLFTSIPDSSVAIANGASLDWRPATGSALRSGGTGTTLPGKTGTRVGSFFGGSLAGTTFLGAIAPDAAAPWYAGWTAYYRN
ncbi:MAG: fibronectin type III domain-containing protein [Gemmatimonadota bacterium]|nr:fibronectin type III domain-containing protein [Gemmatimonadota bacterium]MDQ8174569.1 fibronectin type III domain-containing protein [Gemmatimonadota bacterium]